MTTFGLFEKRKTDRNLKYQVDVDAAAAALLNSYPKIKYDITALGFVPIGLNQTIDVRWKEVDWVLPLTSRNINLNGPTHTTTLLFGGMPLSADDAIIALAAELRAESYGQIVRTNNAIGTGDDPEIQNTVQQDEGDLSYVDLDDFLNPNLPLTGYYGRSAGLMGANEGYFSWRDYII